MTQSSLEQIKGNTYFIPGYVNIGVYVKGSEAVLIDTGTDRSYGKRILKVLGDHGLRVKLIVNTHFHADHIGGNAIIQEETGCRIAAPEVEAAFIKMPILKGALFYGGFPPHSLQNKYLLAEPSVITDQIVPEQEILNTGLQAISLPGHCLGQIGIKTPEQVFFVGDSMMEKKLIHRYHLLYLWDVEKQLQSLEKLARTPAALYIPSHGDLYEDLYELIEVNRKQIKKICATLKRCCQKGLPTEEVLQRICRIYQLQPGPTEYILLLSTVRSFLSYLYGQGELECRMEEATMVWYS